MTERPGRIRRTLAKMIEARVGTLFDGAVVDCNPDRLIPVTGRWRMNRIHADVMPWNGTASVRIGGRPVDVSVDSWDTMTTLVRSGFNATRKGLSVELHAKQL